jgi:hypothetical protein
MWGLRRKIHMWLSSYLTDQTQFVEIQHVGQKTSNLMYFSSSLNDKTWCSTGFCPGTLIVFIVQK